MEPTFYVAQNRQKAGTVFSSHDGATTASNLPLSPVSFIGTKRKERLTVCERTSWERVTLWMVQRSRPRVLYGPETITGPL